MKAEVDKIGLIFVFLVLFSIYVYRCAPTISSGDSGEFCGVGPSLGIAHPPGYPTYVLISKIFDTLIPFANHAYRINVLSAFFGVVSCLLVLHYTKNYFPLVFFLSSCVIKQNIVAEVFSLNLFFTVVLFIIFKKFTTSKDSRYLFLFSLIYGVGLGNHQILVFLAPAFLVWYLLERIKMDFRNIIGSALCFITGFAIYLFLPIRSMSQPLYDWEDPETLERFIFVLRRGRYGTLQLAQGEPSPIDFGVLLSQMKFFINSVVDCYTIAGILIIAYAIFILLRKDFKSAIIYLLLISFSGPFFIFFTRTPIETEGMKFIMERFIPFSLIFFCFFIGRKFIVGKMKTVVNVISVLLASFLLLKNAHINRRLDFICYDYGMNILNTVPNGSIIFSDRADEMEFTLAYLLKIEKKKEVEFIDCNAGVSRSIYGDDYYGIWGEKRLRRRERIESEIIAKTEKPVYYATFLPKQTDIPKVCSGLLYEAKHLKTEYHDWHEIYALRTPVEFDIRQKGLYISFYDLVGRYFLKVRKPEIADRFFKALKSNDKNQTEVIAYLYLSEGFLEQAEREYRDALSVSKNKDQIYINLGAVYEKMNRLDDAIKSYSEAIKMDPHAEQAYYNLAVVYWRKQDWKKVVELLEKVLSINPNHIDARRYLEIAKGRCM